nr:hypothetical protein [Tanacetum cinerariifolium]
MGNATTNTTKVIHCYNYRGKGHIARQCTQPKRPKKSRWFKEKMLLAQALTDDLDALDSDCDEAPSYSEQPIFVDDTNIKITSDNNVILYEQYLQQNGNEVVQDTTSSEQQDAMIVSVIEEMSNHVAKCNAVNQENKTVN